MGASGTITITAPLPPDDSADYPIMFTARIFA